jgi:hypothetical protein
VENVDEFQDLNWLEITHIVFSTGLVEHAIVVPMYRKNVIELKKFCTRKLISFLHVFKV